MSKTTVLIKFIPTKRTERPRIRVDFGTWYSFEAELPDMFLRDVVTWWQGKAER